MGTLAVRYYRIILLLYTVLTVLYCPLLVVYHNPIKKILSFYARSYPYKTHVLCMYYYCERSELLIRKVHQSGLGCIKNCARIDQPEYHFGTSLIHFGVVIFGTSLILYSVIILSISVQRMYVLFRGLYIRYFFDPFRNGVVCPIPDSLSSSVVSF